MDEENLLFGDFPEARRARVFRALQNMNFETACSFRQRFRVNPETFEAMLSGLRDDLEPSTFRSHAFNAETQLKIALRFMATGSFYHLLGDGHGPSPASVCRIVRRVSKAISERFGHVLDWPTTGEELDRIRLEFHAAAGMPNVIGAIDGTHVNIRVPAAKEDTYMNRKGRTSINVLAVAGPRREVLALSVHASGRCHDAEVLRTSGLMERFGDRTDARAPNGVVLGDSAYPNLDWLLTPVAHPRNVDETRYNGAHTRTRVIVENLFGTVKMRFPSIDGKEVRLKKIEDAATLIHACFVVHNLCILGQDFGEWLEQAAPDPAHRREAAADTEPEPQEPVDEPPTTQDGHGRNAARQAGGRRRQAMIRHLRATRQ